jgi:nitric-oxide synthase
VRDLAGRNPLLLVGTKLDLLPKGTDALAVADWLGAQAAFRRVAPLGVHLVSGRSGEGMAEAAGALRRARLGRDVFVVGAANVGKSAFVRALVR